MRPSQRVLRAAQLWLSCFRNKVRLFLDNFDEFCFPYKDHQRHKENKRNPCQAFRRFVTMSQAPPPSNTNAPAPPAAEFVNEVPSSLKQLARLVVRGFYGIEDALIIDMLVRHPCMREEDIAGLLKFDIKMLRARMVILKNDKFLQVSFFLNLMSNCNIKTSFICRLKRDSRPMKTTSQSR